MNAKNITAFLLAIIICISVSACSLTGEPEATPIPNSFVGRWVSDDDAALSYVFNEDLSFHEMQGTSEVLAGTYTYDEHDAWITVGENGEKTITVELIADGTVTVNTGTGANVFFRRVSDSEQQNEESNLGDVLTTDNGDGTVTAEYLTLKLKATYPETMSISSKTLSEPAILLTDSNNGYCTVRDLTQYYGRFTGTADEFITAYINDYIYPDFGELYDGYPGYTDFNITHPSVAGRFATADIELYKGDNDIEVVVYINAVTDEATGAPVTLTAITYFAPRSAKEQLQTLREAITDCLPLE